MPRQRRSSRFDASALRTRQACEARRQKNATGRETRPVREDSRHDGLHVVLRRRDGADAEAAREHLHDVGREKRRQRRPDAEIAEAERDERQHDRDGLLLVPRDIERERQAVDVVEPERVLERERDDRQRIAVVALPGVEDARNAVDIALHLLDVAVLCATRGEDDRVLGQGRRDLRVVVAREVASVAAGHHHELLDLARLHGFDDLVLVGEDLVVSESADERSRLKRRRRRAALRALDHLREVLRTPALAVRDVRNARIAGDARREDAVAVGVQHRHDAVRRHHDRAVEHREVLLLLIPRAAVVALEMRTLPESRIVMRRQHLAVRVDVDARAGRLLEDLGEVPEVVSRHEDAGTHPDVQFDGRRRRLAVHLRVGRVEERHHAHRHPSRVHHQRRHLVDGLLLAHRLERAEEKLVDGLLLAAEDGRVMRVGRDALQSEERKLLQAADVGIRRRERPRRLVRDEVSEMALARRDRATQARVVEVRVREREEERVRHEAPQFLRRLRLLREVLESRDEHVHEVRGLGSLAAHAAARAASIAESLLALTAEHRGIIHSLLLLLWMSGGRIRTAST